MNLAIVVVSYNVRDLLRTCLRSVFASAAQSADWLQVDVVVVDNASRDGSAEMVATEFPAVHLIASDENLGFPAGNNLALRMMGFGGERGREGDTAPLISPSPDFVLLLNPDTELAGDALGEMAAGLRDHPRAGACGAHLRYGDGRFQHGAFQFPNFIQVALDLLPLADAPLLRRLLPRLLDSRLNGRYPQRSWEGTDPFPVDFVLGAAMMVRGEAIHQVGLLDEAFFMYCEEMDWCLRLWRAGWPVYAVPTARVIHHEGQSSKQVRWTAFERLWRSRFRFYRKHADFFPPGYTFLLQPLMQSGLAIRGWQARRRFAAGKTTGDTLAEELDAYRRVAALQEKRGHK